MNVHVYSVAKGRKRDYVNDYQKQAPKITKLISLYLFVYQFTSSKIDKGLASIF